MHTAFFKNLAGGRIHYVMLAFCFFCALSLTSLTGAAQAEGDSAYRNRVTAPRIISSISMPLSKELHFTGTALYDNALYGTFGYGALEYAFTDTTAWHSGYIFFREPHGDVMMARFGPAWKFQYQQLQINGRLLLEGHFTTRPQHVASYFRVRPKIVAALNIFPDSDLKPAFFGGFEPVFATHYKKVIERLDYAAGIAFKPSKSFKMTLGYYRWHWTVPNKKDSQGVRVTMQFILPYKQNGVETDTLWEEPASVAMAGEE